MTTMYDGRQGQDSLACLLRRAGVDADVLLAFRDTPVTRILAAFACAKCAPPDGHALCLADQINHRVRRWAAGDGDPGPLAPAGYADRTLLGACIRALVPDKVVHAVVDAILCLDDTETCDNVRVCADRDILSKKDATPLRLCKPSARDRARLRAWAWLNSMAAERARAWVGCIRASGPFWEDVARPCASTSRATILSLNADLPCGLRGEVDAVALAQYARDLEDDAARGRVERLVCHLDARTTAFLRPPYYTGDYTSCNVFIEGDALFGLGAKW
ncbi:hypothetical protein psal_cds_455 [Pandoravirus salinus]|uniref:Uncharacterized protein n=1 Tax=Pandoravirus salinus TaxID=1349410 RepID=S4VXM6_9VIRU|nr:hypothetical protein psal_cds_455 [Pandoravirus salinus]AGO84211.1 hypothetical protein psal_cds_455 [Pandoravirus salinus]